MKNQYKHICIMELPIIDTDEKELRHKTLIIWLGKFDPDKSKDTLKALTALNNATDHYGIYLAVKFVAMNLKPLTSEQKSKVAVDLEQHDAGLLDTQGMSMKEFGRWYDDQIEQKIKGLQKLDEDEAHKKMDKLVRRRLEEKE